MRIDAVAFSTNGCRTAIRLKDAFPEEDVSIYCKTTSDNLGVERIPGPIEGVSMDHLHISCEGAIMIAGEKESPIRGVSIRDSTFVWTQQGSLPPDCLDEQPSRRGVYPCQVPMAYIRCGEEISVCENVSYKIDKSMKNHIREEIVTE